MYPFGNKNQIELFLNFQSLSNPSTKKEDSEKLAYMPEQKIESQIRHMKKQMSRNMQERITLPIRRNRLH